MKIHFYLVVLRPQEPVLFKYLKNESYLCSVGFARPWSLCSDGTPGFLPPLSVSLMGWAESGEQESSSPQFHCTQGCGESPAGVLSPSDCICMHCKPGNMEPKGALHIPSGKCVARAWKLRNRGERIKCFLKTTPAHINEIPVVHKMLGSNQANSWMEFRWLHPKVWGRNP